jgi:hypothetical protein
MSTITKGLCKQRLVIYRHPLAYVLGLEGRAALLLDAAELGDGVELDLPPTRAGSPAASASRR